MQIWRLHMPLGINDRSRELERLSAVLTPEEQTRAARYHFDADRRRFAWTRGLLRTLLGYYVDMPPDRIQFGAGPKGKLQLIAVPSSATGAWQFNVSHSHEWAFLALSRDRACLLYTSPSPRD